MEFREIIAVTGVAGLKKMIANRNDGLILCELDGSNKKFYSNRQHMFSPLDNISIYTEDDTVPLLDVFIEMKNQKDKTSSTMFHILYIKRKRKRQQAVFALVLEK